MFSGNLTAKKASDQFIEKSIVDSCIKANEVGKSVVGLKLLSQRWR